MKFKKLVVILIVFSVLSFSCATKVEEPATQVVTEKEYSIQELIMLGKINEAKALFQSKVNINAADEEGNTALHIAAKVNNSDIISFLIFYGANSGIKNYAGQTPLHVAIENDSRDACRILVEHKDCIFLKDNNGKTPLDIILDNGKDYYDIFINANTANILDTKGQNIVHHIVTKKNLEALKICINKNIPLSIIDNDNKTPLHIAYENSKDIESIKIAAELLMANATPLRQENFSYFEDAIKTRNTSLRFVDGQTPLHIACSRKEVGIVEYLLNRGASVHAKDVIGNTPLHLAVSSSDIAIIKLLLANNASANSQNIMGDTPLMIIPQNKDTRADVYDLLLKSGGNPNAKNNYGDTPLHIAVMAGMDISILKSLTDAGADINERNKEGKTPLTMAVNHMDIEQVRFLTQQKNADIHAEDNEGTSPLIIALTLSPTDVKEKSEILKLLVTQKNISSRDSYGNSPLHIAVAHNTSSEQLDYLLSLSPEVNGRNKKGETAIFLAVKNNRRKLGESLLANGADVFSANNKENSALKYAMSMGGEIQEWLLTSEVIKASDGIGNTPLHYASEWKFNNSVAILLEKGANPNTQNANGETPLFYAVKSNSVATISILLEKGASKDIRDFLGNTALHYSVTTDQQDAAKKLILSGIDINAKNLAGQTALAEAVSSGKVAMISTLLDNGADINASDATGKTVLMNAIKGGNKDIVALLLKRGASPLMQEMYGRNAYHEAAESKNIEIIEMVRLAGGMPLSRDAHGVTPFSLVMNNDEKALKEIIIKRVLGDNSNLVDSDGNNPLHIAVENRIIANNFSILLNQNYPIDARNRKGITPLAMAVKSNQYELASQLLENGADPYILDNSGECALTFALKNNYKILEKIVQTCGRQVDMVGDGILHYAARMADVETMKKLVTMGLDKTLKNISGEKPYDMAIRWQRPEIADLLK